MDCVICGAKLSEHNRLDRCWCHGYVKGVPETIVIDRPAIVGSLCTSPPDRGLGLELKEQGYID
jgi:hypothetical protein